MDGDVLNEIIIPTTNVDRLLPDGTRKPEELVNKSQTFINLIVTKLRNFLGKPFEMREPLNIKEIRR